MERTRIRQVGLLVAAVLWGDGSAFSIEPSYLKPWHDIHAAATVGVRTLAQEPVFAGDDTVRWRFEPPLEFSNAFEHAIVAREAMAKISKMLEGIGAMTVGGWFHCRRTGEQTFFCRGVPVIAPAGERVFVPRDEFVTFCLGMDQRGFFLGTIHGNGAMPFPYVTLNEIYINEWHQLVVVKDAAGHQTFYQNGQPIHNTADRLTDGLARKFSESPEAAREPIRLAMPAGGKIGEVWLSTRAVTPAEVQKDYLDKKDRYKAAGPYLPVILRQMDLHPAVNRWPEPPTKDNWPALRREILNKVQKRLGTPPAEKVPLDLEMLGEEDCGDYLRREVSFAVQPARSGEPLCVQRMPGYLLIPKVRQGRVPAVICMYGTTSGTGKDTTVGLSGRERGSKPHPNYSFALDMVQAGFIAFAPDWLRDGERVRPGERPYESTSFQREFPNWSISGKDVWDTSRAVDYLQTLDLVDPNRIGMVGHSYGAGGTIHAAALDERIKVAVANGPVSDPKEYHELTALIAPRPLLVGQAVGERRPEEEEIYAAVSKVYHALGYPERVYYVWYPGDHDFPPAARKMAVDWLRRWFEPHVPASQEVQ